MLMETGYYMNLSGCGDILDTFIQDKNVKNYSGENSQVVKQKESGFWNGKLRYMPFNSTFTFLPTDVDDRQYFS